MKRYDPRCFGLAAALLGLLLAGCAEEQTPLPTETAPRGEVVAACETLCIVFENGMPFRVARSNPDSGRSRITLGAFRLVGKVGGAATLQLEAPAAWWDAVPDSASVELGVNGEFRRVRLTALRQGYVFYRFVGADSIDLQLRLRREFAPLPEAPVRLLLRITGGRVIEAKNPWTASTPARLRALSGASVASEPCGFNAPGTWCGVVVGIEPFFQGTAWTSTGFQSGPGTGPSVTIGISFDQPVADFTIDVYDPNFPGNQVVAYDSLGAVIGSVDVPGDGTPGKNPPTIEHVVMAVSGIRAIDLIPGSGD